MTAERRDLTWQSRDELLVLHAVRLAGFADTDAVADRVDLPLGVVHDILRVLEGQDLIERMTFADSGGWILTVAGKSRDAALLKKEHEASGARSLLQGTAEDFEAVNARLVRAITDWQLHPSNDRAGGRAEVLRELTVLADALSGLMAGLAAELPRFSRYDRQFSAALGKAHAGDDE